MAKRLNVDRLSLITSGNNGYSLAVLAKSTGVKVSCLVSERLNKHEYDRLDSVACQVIKLNLDEVILTPEK